jgi:hypothetical protein
MGQKMRSEPINSIGFCRRSRQGKGGARQDAAVRLIWLEIAQAQAAGERINRVEVHAAPFNHLGNQRSRPSTWRCCYSGIWRAKPPADVDREVIQQRFIRAGLPNLTPAWLGWKMAETRRLGDWRC